MFSIKIKGEAQAKKNIDRSQETAGKIWEVRVRQVIMFVLKKSNEQVPVEYGNLKASGFARVKGQGFKSVGSVGYTAEYAIYVHENLDAAHGDDYNTIYRKDIAAGRKRARGSGQKSKFLEDAIRENEFAIRDIFAGKKSV